MKLVARLFIVAGIILLVIGLFQLWERYDANRLAFYNYEYNKDEVQLIKTNNLPTNISIANIGVEDVKVIPAKIEGKHWQTTKQGVSYLVSSPVPGNQGNSIMYAHNWAGLFANLSKIKDGDIVEITYADNTKKTFEVAYTLEVSPGDQSILTQSTDTRLTLYTCTGFLDSKRFVAVAFLK